MFNTANLALTTHKVPGFIYNLLQQHSSSSGSEQQKTSIMLLFLCSVLQIAVVFHFPFPYYFIWFGTCVVHAQPYLHPCGYLTHTQRTTCSRHGIPHTSTAFRYPDIPAAYFTTLTSQLKTNTRQQCCSPSDHTTQCAALYIAHCSYDTYNATTLGDITAELANATTYDCVIRAERKIEDRDRDSDLGDLD